MSIHPLNSVTAYGLTLVTDWRNEQLTKEEPDINQRVVRIFSEAVYALLSLMGAGELVIRSGLVFGASFISIFQPNQEEARRWTTDYVNPALSRATQTAFAAVFSIASLSHNFTEDRIDLFPLARLRSLFVEMDQENLSRLNPESDLFSGLQASPQGCSPSGSRDEISSFPAE